MERAFPEALMEPPPGLADQLGCDPGVRFVRINASEGTRITRTITCEQELWRVARIEPGTCRAGPPGPCFPSVS